MQSDEEVGKVAQAVPIIIYILFYKNEKFGNSIKMHCNSLRTQFRHGNTSQFKQSEFIQCVRVHVSICLFYLQYQIKI